MLNVPYSGSVTTLALEWYIVGPMLGCIVIFAVGWYICKRRRAGEKNTDSAQTSSNKWKTYLLKIYSQHSNFLKYHYKHLPVIHYSR